MLFVYSKNKSFSDRGEPAKPDLLWLLMPQAPDHGWRLRLTFGESEQGIKQVSPYSSVVERITSRSSEMMRSLVRSQVWAASVFHFLPSFFRLLFFLFFLLENFRDWAPYLAPPETLQTNRTQSFTALWPNGKALDFGSKDCGFESYRGRLASSFIFFWAF